MTKVSRLHDVKSVTNTLSRWTNDTDVWFEKYVYPKRRYGQSAICSYGGKSQAEIFTMREIVTRCGRSAGRPGPAALR
ncbi:hypothetical protein EVAR_17029_1 [Eumeta japonica]|uniref:Uncharacterized protein n=1 Tax=Eumeta variegata TaxID=151549 RepID=A0A4C1V4G8_EUMVA|nr:hypothetical protein EVAR_17029_1 [Eumeta japonica]